MGKVFVSHASLDRELVDAFVDRVLKLGCGLNGSEIFYSSDLEMGVPQGQPLIEHVRQQVEEADLVIAIVSPTYQTRPVCVAELGAAWSAGKLFPIAVPGLDRSDMEGVLQGLTIMHLDHGKALDRLAAQVGSSVRGQQRPPGEWNPHKERWLVDVADLAAALPEPEVITTDQYAAALAETEGVRAALRTAVEEHRAVEARFDRLKAAKTHAEVEAAIVPEDEAERFEVLLAEGADAIGDLKSFVQVVMRHEVTEGPMTMPDHWDHRNEDARALAQDGYLVNDDGQLTTNEKIPAVARAWAGFRALQQMFDDGVSEEFDANFEARFQVPADLSIGLTWDKLF